MEKLKIATGNISRQAKSSMDLTLTVISERLFFHERDKYNLASQTKI